MLIKLKYNKAPIWQTHTLGCTLEINGYRLIYKGESRIDKMPLWMIDLTQEQHTHLLEQDTTILCILGNIFNGIIGIKRGFELQQIPMIDDNIGIYTTRKPTIMKNEKAIKKLDEPVINVKDLRRLLIG